MPTWACPNTKCTYDKELQPRQHCPLCGKKAQSFKFSEFGNLLKDKWDFKKQIEKAKKHEKASKKVKFCPKCGSTNINSLVFYRPSIWKCLDCGYEGALILEDSKPAEKTQEQYRRTS